MTPVFYRRDCVLIGILMGIALPPLLWLILSGMNMVIVSMIHTPMVSKPHYLYLLSIVINLFPMRYYFSKLGYEKTGMGLLLISVAGILGYFYLFGVSQG